MLDEATSGLAPEVVSTVYKTFQTRGIQTITFTQALVEPALRYHTRALRLGECCSSGWQVQELSEQQLTPSKTPQRAPVHGDNNTSVALEDGRVCDGSDSDEEPEGDTPLVAG